MPSRPLAGVAVLDLSLNLPGPYATRLLLDLGATVTKIEPPRGDPAAAMPVLYRALNEGKERRVLDLQSDGGRTDLHALIRDAQVLVEGFRPGVAERLGFGPAAAHATNPRLIYCSLSAFGQDGPLRDLPGHDLNLQALAGVCHLGRDALGRPRGLPLPVADLAAASTAALKIVAALHDREAEGRRIDVALLDTAQEWAHLWGTGVDLAATPSLSARARRVARAWLGRQGLHALPHYGCFRCRDGQWLAVGIVDERHFWRALCEELGLRPLADLRLPTRALLGAALRWPIALRFALHPRRYWLDRLGARGIPVTPVLAPADAPAHPQVASRNARGAPPSAP